MDTGADSGSLLDALSDAEYDRRISDAIGTVIDRIEDAIRSEDPLENELLYAAAPTALRNILAHLVAEDCLGEPRPYKLVKETVRDLDLEGIALAVLKELQAGDAAGDGPADAR